MTKSAQRWWISGCGSISGLLVQLRCLLAPMDSADPRLILLEGSMPGPKFRFGGSRSYLLAITSCRTWCNLSCVPSSIFVVTMNRPS